MDESVLFNGVMQAVFGGRTRRGRKAMRYVTGTGASMGGALGHTLLSNPQALLTAAGLAWGVFETMQGGQAQGQGQWGGGGGVNAGGATSGAGFNPAPAAGSGSLPPLPVMGAASPASGTMTDATRMVKLALSAAQADGSLSAQERDTVLAKAKDAGLGDLVDRELHQQAPLVDIVAGVSDPAQRATLYNLAFAVVRADEQVGGAERIYLAQLANLLGLDPPTVQKLEAAASANIDAVQETA